MVQEIICLAILLAASASTSDDILKRLETWSPLITVLCAGAPSLAFDSYIPEHRSPDDEHNGHDEEHNSG